MLILTEDVVPFAAGVSSLIAYTIADCSDPLARVSLSIDANSPPTNPVGTEKRTKEASSSSALQARSDSIRTTSSSPFSADLSNTILLPLRPVHFSSNLGAGAVIRISYSLVSSPTVKVSFCVRV